MHQFNRQSRKKRGVNLANQKKEREKVICPKCNSDEVAHILYGYPTPEARKEAKNGKYHLGGCELGSFFWHCRKCKHEW